MRRRNLIGLPLAVMGAGVALAQDQRVDRRPPEQVRGDPHIPYGRDGREPQFDRGGRDPGSNRGDRDDDRDRREQAWRQQARRDRRHFGDNPPRYQRGAGPYRNYYPGGRLPAEYQLRHYVVGDWRGHGLSAPPRGYHWVQTGGDYVLVAIATGVILQLLLRD
jgi:Ni/Co efflux regulator RcnB